MNNTSDNGQQDFWIDGDTYQSYNTGQPVKEESFWIDGSPVEFLQSDPTSLDFLGFFF
jgi:hypothetical protein